MMTMFKGKHTYNIRTHINVYVYRIRNERRTMDKRHARILATARFVLGVNFVFLRFFLLCLAYFTCLS